MRQKTKLAKKNPPMPVRHEWVISVRPDQELSDQKLNVTRA
jgi:hypothetical protein